MNAKFNELLTNLSMGTCRGEVIINQEKFRTFLRDVRELITEVEVDAGRAGFAAGVIATHQAFSEPPQGIVYSLLTEEYADQYADKIRRGEV